MQGKRVERVASIEDKKRETVMRDATLMAEAMARDNPSPESKAWVDEKLVSDPTWREYGNLTAQAMDLALKGFYLGYVTKAGVKRGAQLLKIELGFETASPVERMMIEHVVVCNVRLAMVEHLYSRCTSNDIDVIEHWERRLTLAQKRFTRAVTTLARVRGLLARAETAQAHAGRANVAKIQAMQKTG